jgi:Ca-activated chloride channel family protein
MTFVHPWVLMLLAIPVLLGFWLGQRRTWGLALPFDHQQHGRRRVTRVLLTAFDLVPALLLAVVLVILARPQVLRLPKEERILTNIQICMDVSGSMTADNRYGMAKAAIEEFLDAREGDAIGFTIFGTQQVRWTPLTKDLETIRRALPFADPRNQPPHMGGTMIGAALRFCRDNMVAEAEEGDRLIILVSDGVSFDLNSGNAGDVGDELIDAGITLYHVHVGTSQVPQEVTEIANMTGGEAFVATDKKGLDRVFRHIDLMQPARFKQATAIPMDWFVPFAIGGLALVGLHMIGLMGMRYTPW